MRLLLAALATGAVGATSPGPAADIDLVRHINSDPARSWRARVGGPLASYSRAQVARLCGERSSSLTLPVKSSQPSPASLPDAFDARTVWGGTCNSLYEVRDQAGCGGCWAFGAVEAMTDRICIHSNGTKTPHLSALEVISCDNNNSYGCDGGDSLAAWTYWGSDGIVTGGSFNDDTKGGCAPFPFPRCEHLNSTGPYPKCEHDYTPYCPYTCADQSPKDAFKHFGVSAYLVNASVPDIQIEIITNGPVEASFSVYEDFVPYQSGVYVHSTGNLLGGHAIKIVGWGVSNSTEGSLPYWTIANSWNQDWGEAGFFRILRGQDECGIEQKVVAGMPAL